MLKSLRSLLPICVIFLASAGTLNAQFTYMSPLPDSKYHNRETQLIFRITGTLDESAVYQKDLVEIYGSESGLHQWTASLSEGRTLIVKPTEIFAWGESVQVHLKPVLRRANGTTVEGASFSFKIRNEMTDAEKARYATSTDDDLQGDNSSGNTLREECSTDSLPAYEVTINNNPAPGQIFHNNQSDNKKDTNSFPTIINNDGSLVWACDRGLNGHDFKINYNGYLTYFDYPYNGWMVLDSNFNTIDTVQCGNGYESETNGHEIVMYPDGHTFVIAYNPQTIDMSQVVPGGKTNALVKGLIIQELDINKQVIFEWRSWDHFLITDANNTEDLTASIIDPIHGNALERDQDGNLLLSSRNMSEITKINLETGDFVWRMGGENNQFTFVNDNIPQNFNYQHDIRRLPNGNVTLFNNGVYLPVQRSSAKEYHLDEVNKIATLIWYYEHPMVGPANVFGTGSGSIQRLSNGNSIISWGKTINSSSGIPNYTEVDENNNIVWEFKFTDSLQRGYRVHKYIWNPCAVPLSTGITVKKITDNSAKIDWAPVNNALSYDLEYRKLGKPNWKLKNTTNSSKKLINLKPLSSYEFRLRTYCLNGYVSDWTPADTFTTEALRIFVTEPAPFFQVYPNPAAAMLNIKFETADDQTVTITFYDVSGKKFLQQTLSIENGETETGIDVSSLASGIYLVKAVFENRILTQKFLKQ
ncbi:MAG TPA: arylsulfotransferase family protein [Chitinophagales bacterium]|nr:arylsulfotransferase family protein [Chitinophagales bacterium]